MDISLQPRAYRKPIKAQGRMYLANDRQDIVIKNISTSGMLVRLNEDHLSDHHKPTLETLFQHKTIHFCIPPFQLSGNAKIIRVFTNKHLQVYLGMTFQHLASCGANASCTNDSPYTSGLAIPGRLLLRNDYFDFMTVSLSENDFIIRLPIIVGVEKGMVLAFELTQANLKGQVKVVSVLDINLFETVMKLEYLKPENGADIGQQVDYFLPRPHDCPITHRLRIFSALKDKQV